MSQKPTHVHTVRLAQPIPTKENKLWHLLTGGVAGGISRTVTSPLERLKILRQCLTPGYRDLNLWGSIVKFYRTEGTRGFLKGNGANVVKIVPFSALEFFTFEVCKEHLLTAEQPRHKGKLLLCGGIAGVVASIVTYPLDLVRTILSIHTDRAKHGIVEELANTYRLLGVTGLYRGLLMSLWGIAPFIGIKMSCFDLLKARYLPGQDHPSFNAMNLILGGAAGTISMFITYPTDLLRRKIQLLAFEETKNVPYSGIRSCIAYVYKTEGAPGFYRGCFPSFLKVAPSMAIVFAVNERLKKRIGIK